MRNVTANCLYFDKEFFEKDIRGEIINSDEIKVLSIHIDDTVNRMDLDVSVVIPVYNAGALIKRCLDSILAQKGGCSYEVLLVDDGSTDDSVAIIKSYENQCFKVFCQENAGPAKARNKGLQEAKGRYVAFIDADDYWEDTFFEKTVGFLDAHHECIAVTVGQRHLTVSGDHLAPACLGDYKEPIVLENFFAFWGTWMHVCTGSIMIRKVYAEKTGGQRADLRITEDLEFWALLATYGKYGFIPEVLFTSDGTDVIRDQKGWLKKMQIRWTNAPSIAEWERRIVSNQPALETDEDYLTARGSISRNLTYCQLLSGRTSMARREAKRYGRYFTKDAIGKLMNMAKWTPVTWWLLCKLLKYREYHRF